MPIHISSHRSREACLRALPIETDSGKVFPDTASLQSSGCFSSLLFYDDQCPDFCIRLSHYLMGSDNSSSRQDPEQPLLILQFVLQDSLHCTFRSCAKHTVAEGQYNLIMAPSLDQVSWFDPANRHTGTLDIHFSRSYLEGLCADLPALKPLLSDLRQGKMPSLAGTPSTLDPVMLHYLNAILCCPYTGQLRRTYMQTKVFVLAIIALEQMLSRPAEKSPSISLNRYEIEKIHEARQYMRQHIENPPTLKELARKMGINDFKLKKAYKQIFHNTIFGDFNDFRMEKARSFLLETDLSISDISLSTGYEDPPNFIRAFKAHFGSAPSIYRKQHSYHNDKRLS